MTWSRDFTHLAKPRASSNSDGGTQSEEQQVTEQTTMPACASCGPPISNLELRSRTIQSTLIKCGAFNCVALLNCVVHFKCAEAETQKLSSEWTCAKHTSSEHLSGDVSVQSENPPTPANPRPEITSKSEAAPESNSTEGQSPEVKNGECTGLTYISGRFVLPG